MFVLILEQKGDYEDYYQRPSAPVAFCEEEAPLQKLWDDLPVTGEFEDQPLKTFEGSEYIAGYVCKLPHVSEVR